MRNAGEMRILGAFTDSGLRGAPAEMDAGHISLFFVQKESAD